MIWQRHRLSNNPPFETVQGCASRYISLTSAQSPIMSHASCLLHLVAWCCMECQEPRQALPHGLPSHSPEQLSALITSKLAHCFGQLQMLQYFFLSWNVCIKLPVWSIDILTYWLALLVSRDLEAPAATDFESVDSTHVERRQQKRCCPYWLGSALCLQD